MARPRHIVAIDLGTTKVLAAAASCSSSAPTLVAHGGAPCAALRRGVVVDLEAAAAAIGQAVAPVLQALRGHPGGVWVGVTGAHLECCNLQGSCAVASPEVGVTRAEVDAALQAAGATLALPSDREVVNAIPRSFAIDGQAGVTNPVGMSARALEVSTHVVTGTTTLLDNLEKAVLRAGLAVEELVFEPIAAAHAVLTPADRDLGTLLVDVGGGTTDFALFVDGGVCHSGSVPLAGAQVTRDLAMALGLELAEAERIKLAAGHCLYQEIGEEEEVPARSLQGGEQRISRRYLAGLIAARMEEIFRLLAAEVAKSQFTARLTRGMVLTGGSAQLPGIGELARTVTGWPVRLGRAQGVVADPALSADPAWATALGLLLYASAQQSEAAWPERRSPWHWLLRFLHLAP